MRAIILAGGKGTRLRPITAVLPKPLVPIGDKPILEILIRQLRKYGFDHITIAAGYLAGIVKAVFNDGTAMGVKIDYSVEEKPLGTVGPLTLINNLDEDFLVLNGDILTNLNFKKFMEFHQRKKACVSIAVYERQEQVELGILQLERGKVKKYLEKPRQKFLVSSGIYACHPKVIGLLKKNEFADFPHLINRLIKRGDYLAGYIFRDIWLDLGRPDDYIKGYELYEKDPALFS